MVERKPHQVVSLSFKEAINDPTPLEALEETSQPESMPNCLQWGTRNALALGNQRLLCEVADPKPSLPFPGFSFQAIALLTTHHFEVTEFFPSNEPKSQSYLGRCFISCSD